MTRQNISIGSAAMAGDGDNFRLAGKKINETFIEVYKKLGGDSNILTTGLSFTNTGIVFEGTLVDSFQTTLSVDNPTNNRTISLPDASGSIILDTATQTLTNKTIISPTLITPKINDLSSNNQYTIIAPELSVNTNINLPVLTDSDTFTFNSVAQTLLNKTLLNPSITSPRISTDIKDVNGAQLIGITATSSAVSNITLANAAAGNSPIVGVSSADSDVSISLEAKNGGGIVVSKLVYSMATITADGALPKTASYINCNSSTALALTLANGIVTGEAKKITNSGAGTVTITPASFAQGTSFSLEQNESCEIIWNGTSWFIIANQSTVTIA